MQFKLSIDCDNSALENDDRGHELARILRDVADALSRNDMKVCERDYAWSRPLVDVNGNTVGRAHFTD
jgi:hypothetical protein